MSTKTLNVLNGISHVLGAYGHDGATDDEGEPVSIGLHREKGHPINDSRVIDGFSIKTYSDKLWICYHLETTLKKLHKKANFETEIKATINDVKSFLQKEYKKATGRALSLKDPEEPVVTVEYISRVRTAVYAAQCFTIGGVDAESIDATEADDRLDTNFKKFLDQGGWSSDSRKQPDNVSRKKEKSEPFNPSKMDSIIK